MLVGFKMLFSIIGILGDVVPFIGDVMRFATGLLSLAITAVISTLVIGIAWVYFRPVIGISNNCCGVGAGYRRVDVGQSQGKTKRAQWRSRGRSNRYISGKDD